MKNVCEKLGVQKIAMYKMFIYLMYLIARHETSEFVCVCTPKKTTIQLLFVCMRLNCERKQDIRKQNTEANGE